MLSPSPRSARRLELPKSVNLCNLVLFSSCWLVFTGESVSSCWSLWSLACSWSLVRISSPFQPHFSITDLKTFNYFRSIQDQPRSDPSCSPTLRYCYQHQVERRQGRRSCNNQRRIFPSQPPASSQESRRWHLCQEEEGKSLSYVIYSSKQGLISVSTFLQSYKPSATRKADQITVDKQILLSIKEHADRKVLLGYLKSRFGLSTGQLPHAMKF